MPAKKAVAVSLPDDGTGAVVAAAKNEQAAPEAPPATASVSPSSSGAGVTVQFPPKAEKKSKKKAEEKPPARKPGILSPFAPPGELRSRVKIFVWGDSGVGKTVLSLQFPSPAVVDLDNGTDPYKDKFGFSVKKTSNVDEVRRLVEWLGTNQHPYSTLVIDPITILWESMLQKWSDIFLQRNTKSKGYKHEFYDMQPKDWKAPKADLKKLIRMLLALDMNIVVTARSKPKYRSSGEDFMAIDGETFDGDKSLPYMFDTVLHLENLEGKRMVACTKDRWNVFPTGKRVPLDFDRIKKYWSKMNLDAPATQVVLPVEEIASDPQPQEQVISTAAQHEQLRSLLKSTSATDEMLASALSAREAKTIEDLSSTQIDGMIHNLQKMFRESQPSTEQK